MELSWAGLRVIVTAGGQGIGYAIATAFLENGARVHICDVDAARLAACRAAWPELGTTVADVSEPVQVDRLFEEAVGRFRGLDILVNNAGISGPVLPVEEISPEAWRQTMAVNIDGQFYCARRAVPLIKQAGGGSIVNISSTAGLFGYPLRSPYAASKWAVIGFTKTLAMELGKFNIRVNAICPGSINGPRMDRVIQAEAATRSVAPELVREHYTKQVSMNTFIEAEEIANLVLFICSPAGAKISGQALCVDGHTETLRT
jgi:NAD(P)-dependent dehydrogenase (short-subunit alcohol dehydrogenase family)